MKLIYTILFIYAILLSMSCSTENQAVEPVAENQVIQPHEQDQVIQSVAESPNEFQAVQSQTYLSDSTTQLPNTSALPATNTSAHLAIDQVTTTSNLNTSAPPATNTSALPATNTSAPLATNTSAPPATSQSTSTAFNSTSPVPADLLNQPANFAESEILDKQSTDTAESWPDTNEDWTIKNISKSSNDIASNEEQPILSIEKNLTVAPPTTISKPRQISIATKKIDKPKPNESTSTSQINPQNTTEVWEEESDSWKDKNINLPNQIEIPTTSSDDLENKISKNLTNPSILKKVGELPTVIENSVELIKGNYILEQQITIQQGALLKISPGTNITLAKTGIICHGKLLCEGTVTEPIQLQGQQGWDNIIIEGKYAEGKFTYCQIHDGLGVEIRFDEEGICRFNQGNQIIGGAILFANQSKGTLQNCNISNNFAQGAIAIVGNSNVKIQNSLISDNQETGILCQDSTINLLDSTIQQNRHGVMLQGKTQGTILGNTCSNHNKGRAFYLRGNSKVTLHKNKISKNTCGIDLSGEDQSSIQQNQIENQKFAGILCDGIVTSDVQQNRLINTGTIGIGIGPDARPNVVANKIVFCHYGIVRLVDTLATIRDNKIENCEIEEQSARLENIRPK